jgi:hypothetical protein
LPVTKELADGSLRKLNKKVEEFFVSEKAERRE